MGIEKGKGHKAQINRVILECKITSNVFRKSSKQEGNTESLAEFEVGYNSQRFQVIFPETQDILNELDLKKNIFIKVYGELKEAYGDAYIVAHGVIKRA